MNGEAQCFGGRWAPGAGARCDLALEVADDDSPALERELRAAGVPYRPWGV